MRARLAAVALFALAAAGCGGHHGAPSVKGKSFPAALARLRAHGRLVSVPFFPLVDGDLWDYRVASQRTSGRRTVTLELEDSATVSIVVARPSPPPVPRLVGQTYRNAYRAARRSGLRLHLTQVKPLRPAASVDGIDAFFVLSQGREPLYTVAVTLGERPCWKTVIQDWYVDASLEGVYARRCYREALNELPVRAYSRLPLLLQRRLR